MQRRAGICASPSRVTRATGEASSPNRRDGDVLDLAANRRCRELEPDGPRRCPATVDSATAAGVSTSPTLRTTGPREPLPHPIVDAWSGCMIPWSRSLRRIGKPSSVDVSRDVSRRLPELKLQGQISSPRRDHRLAIEAVAVSGPQRLALAAWNDG